MAAKELMMRFDRLGRGAVTRKGYSPFPFRVRLPVGPTIKKRSTQNAERRIEKGYSPYLKAYRET